MNWNGSLISTKFLLQTKFCSLVAKPEDRYNVPSGFGVLSEIPEATSAILESRVITALNKYQSYIDYLHISDQFSGPVQQEEGSTLKQPETKAVLLAGFNLPKHAEMETIKPLLLLIFYLMERLKTYRMSKEVSDSQVTNRSEHLIYPLLSSRARLRQTRIACASKRNSSRAHTLHAPRQLLSVARISANRRRNACWPKRIPRSNAAGSSRSRSVRPKRMHPK